MKERPILFSAPMVRAILEGRKTQTRRVVTRLARFGSVTEFGDSTTDGYDFAFRDMRMLWNDVRAAEVLDACPYGAPGDRLWVRETHSIESSYGFASYDPPHKDGRPVHWVTDPTDGSYWQQCHYRATDPAPFLCCEESRCRACSTDDGAPHWRPSIHMPRWASRIDLEVTDVRVERLQDISYEDACAEGCAIPSLLVADFETRTMPAASVESWDETSRRLRWPQRSFDQLWASINGAESFAANPWVWVVEFKRVTP